MVVVNELQERFLDFLDLSGIDGFPSHIRKTTNGLCFKKERENNKSAQEYLATQYARFLLPGTLKMPEIWGVFANHLISRYYPGRPLNKNSKDEIFRAVNYLIEMSDVKFNDNLKNFLIENHYCHYFGDSLKNRLEQELGFSVKAFGKTEEMKDHLVLMRVIIAACLKAKKSYPVLGGFTVQGN